MAATGRAWCARRPTAVGRCAAGECSWADLKDVQLCKAQLLPPCRAVPSHKGEEQVTAVSVILPSACPLPATVEGFQRRNTALRQGNSQTTTRCRARRLG